MKINKLETENKERDEKMREMEERERIMIEENKVREQAMREMEEQNKERDKKIREMEEKNLKMEGGFVPKPNEVFGVDMTEFAEKKRSKAGVLWSIKKEPYLKCIFKANKMNGGEYSCQNCRTALVRRNGRLFL